jgi:hypothetical protein
MADFTNILKHIKQRVPGALADLIDIELNAALDDFFRDSLCWVLGADFTTVVGQTDYEVDPDEGDINMLMNVVNADDRPIAATFAMPNIIRLARAPNTVETLTANYSLRPAPSAPRDIPDWVISNYWQGLVDGTCARMMSQVAKPYFNERMAALHQNRFRNVVSDAKRGALRSYRFRGQGWQYPQAFATRRKR